MKIGLNYSGPFQFVALRSTGSAAVFFLILVVLRRPIRPQNLGYCVALGLLQVTGNLGLIMWALTTGAVGRSSILNFSMPFWVLILPWPILGERTKGAAWAAIALAFAGLILIFNPVGPHGPLVSSAIALGSALFWAGATVITRIMHRHGQVDLLSLAAWQMLFGAIPLILVAFLVPARPIAWEAPFVLALLYSILGASVIAWLLWLFVLRHLPAGTAGVGTLAAPVISIVAAWLQLHELPSRLEATGMGLIVLALAVLTAVAVHRRENLTPTAEIT
jgi:drug/metabolite transporter (DMT)-like permease